MARTKKEDEPKDVILENNTPVENNTDNPYTENTESTELNAEESNLDDSKMSSEGLIEKQNATEEPDDVEADGLNLPLIPDTDIAQTSATMTATKCFSGEDMNTNAVLAQKLF